MNIRQREILRMLMGRRGYLRVQEMADQLSCSEKTIRNDCDVIEAFLAENNHVMLIRKPGAGIKLEADEAAEAQLFHYLQEINKTASIQKELTDQDVLTLAYQLLMGIASRSLHELAHDFYVTKQTIKKALYILEEWLTKKGLELVMKQRVGILIEGSEQNKRWALASLDQLRSKSEVTHPFVYQYFLAYELDIVRKKLKQFQEKHGLFLTDESLENMTVYLLLMIKRTKMKQMVTLSKQDIAYLTSKQEYQWVDSLLLDVARDFQINFILDEIAYFTIHLLGAKIHFYHEEPHLLDVETEQRAIAIASELTKRLTIVSLIPFEQDKNLMEGLRIHLYTTLNRLNFDLRVQNPLVQDIKKMYPYLFDRLVFVLHDMKSSLGFSMPEDEIAYLTLHYQAAIERMQQKQRHKMNVVIVCHLGIGVSEILRSKIQSRFTNVNIVATLAKRDVTSFLSEHKVDLLITTTPLEHTTTNIIVSPLFDRADEKKLMQLLATNGQPRAQDQFSQLRSFVDTEHVLLQLEAAHRFELIEQLAMGLYMDGYVDADYAHQALIRERTAATTIGGGIAIPHGDPSLVKHSTIAVATLKQPINWDGETVSLVFMLAVKNEANRNQRALFQRLTVLAEQPSLVQELIKEDDRQRFLELL